MGVRIVKGLKRRGCSFNFSLKQSCTTVKWFVTRVLKYGHIKLEYKKIVCVAQHASLSNESMFIFGFITIVIDL